MAAADSSQSQSQAHLFLLQLPGTNDATKSGSGSRPKRVGSKQIDLTCRDFNFSRGRLLDLMSFKFIVRDMTWRHVTIAIDYSKTDISINEIEHT